MDVPPLLTMTAARRIPDQLANHPVRSGLPAAVSLFPHLPISQLPCRYYFTQFIGDAKNKPTIKGSPDFIGIALIDCDLYISGGNKANWYINQNQFFRQIRNFRFDLTQIARHNYDNGQEYTPTGIHWQVSQAASLQYLDFIMPVGIRCFWGNHCCRYFYGKRIRRLY
jgi:hypothetical protein